MRSGLQEGLDLLLHLQTVLPRQCRCRFPLGRGKFQSIQMPVVCWQCFMNIDSDSMNFKDFQNCIHTSGSTHLVLGLLLLLAFLFTA